MADTSGSQYGFLTGGINTNDSLDGYLHGAVIAESSKTSYLVGSIYDTQSVYLTGNIAVLDSQNAYIVGLTGSTTSAQYGYCYGILRNTTSAYLEGVLMAAVDYIWLKTSDAGATLSKKFRVLQQDYDDGTLERSESLDKTVGGGIDHSIGAIYKTWSMIIKVRETESEADYGDKDDLEYLYGLNNPNGTPSDSITFIDHHQVEYTVHMVGKMTKNLLGCEIEGTDAWFLYRIQLMRVQ